MFNFEALISCLVITAASSYPYDPVGNFPQEYENHQQQPVTYRKHFYFFSAPEDTDSYDEPIPVELLRKNIHVIVIKVPENKRITTTIARLTKMLAEEKTTIYVLNKEPDLKELTSHIDRLKEEISEKPEVHFIKYKTDEEAELAAMNIQSKYESLHGPSEVNNEETVQLHSYVGSLSGTEMDSKTDNSISLGATGSLVGVPLRISLPLADMTAVEGTDKVKALETPSANDEIADGLMGSMTTSPTKEVDISSELGLFLPPDVISERKGNYLLPSDDQGAETSLTNSKNKKVEEQIE